MALIVSVETLREVLRVGAAVSDGRLERVLGASQQSVLRYLNLDYVPLTAGPTVDDLGTDTIDNLGQDYANNPGVQTAIITVAVDTFGAEVAPGGNSNGLDFTPVPRVNAYTVERAVKAHCLDLMTWGIA